MKTLITIRTLALAAATALASLSAHAGPPGESWWQLDGGTIGLHVEAGSFCAVAADPAARQQGWILHGQVIDGRLVEAGRRPIERPASALLHDTQRETLPQRLAPPDFFIQPTALVSRDRTTEAPRGYFEIYRPLAQAPSSSQWLALAWHCGEEAEVDKLAATAP